MITGIRNVIAVRSQITGSYETTLVVKLIVVVICGVTAAAAVLADPGTPLDELARKLATEG
jgi:hypothetical protein